MPHPAPLFSGGQITSSQPQGASAWVNRKNNNSKCQSFKTSIMGGKSRVLALDRSQYVGAGKESDSKTTGKVYDVFLSLISARSRAGLAGGEWHWQASECAFNVFSFRFTKNLSPNKISVKFLKGEGELHNLELNEKFLSELLEIPPWLRLTKAVCNKISAKVHVYFYLCIFKLCRGYWQSRS